jgi:hypothetical protein
VDAAVADAVAAQAASGDGDRPTLKTSMTHVMSDQDQPSEVSTLDGSPRREQPTTPGLPPKSAV